MTDVLDDNEIEGDLEGSNHLNTSISILGGWGTWLSFHQFDDSET